MATAKGPIVRERGGPAGRAPHGAPRDTLAGVVALLHPGPSLLVTAVTVAAAGLEAGTVPSGATCARVVLLMLPAQLAIGAVNDLADRSLDAATKPAKPLVAGTARASTAAGIAGLALAVSVATALATSAAALLMLAVGLAAGLGYDLGLKRTPASMLTWWAGFAALPLGAGAVVGTLDGRLAWVVPLTGLLALTLHVANALPDLHGDSAGGVRSLPVVLGEGGARAAGGAAGVGVAAAVAALVAVLGQDARVTLPPATALALASLVTLAPGRIRRPFPVLALLAAATAVAWLAALPR